MLRQDKKAENSSRDRPCRRIYSDLAVTSVRPRGPRECGGHHSLTARARALSPAHARVLPQESQPPRSSESSIHSSLSVCGGTPTAAGTQEAPHARSVSRGNHRPSGEAREPHTSSKSNTRSPGARMTGGGEGQQ